MITLFNLSCVLVLRQDNLSWDRLSSFRRTDVQAYCHLFSIFLPSSLTFFYWFYTFCKLFSFITSSTFIDFTNFAPPPWLLESRGFVPGGAQGAMAPPDFGWSVNPISTRGTEYAHLITYYWHPQIFRPCAIPDTYLLVVNNCVIQKL